MLHQDFPEVGPATYSLKNKQYHLFDYDRKVGRGGCEEDNLLANEGGFENEANVQERCSQLSCAFYIWSNDPADLKGTAWLCNAGDYDAVNNADEFPLWRVGRRSIEYQSKAGRGGCEAANLIANEVGFTDEASVQQRCTHYFCHFYIWSNDPADSKGIARFCSSSTYDITRNAHDFPLWRVGQPVSKYQSKLGRGGCTADQLLADEVGFANEISVQERCSQLSCKSYVWSKDPADVKGTAWFCSVDIFDDVHNANDFPLWKVGRNSRRR